MPHHMFVQVEAHPYLQQPALLKWCHAHNITVTAYAPLAPVTKVPGGKVRKDLVVVCRRPAGRARGFQSRGLNVYQCP